MLHAVLLFFTLVQGFAGVLSRINWECSDLVEGLYHPPERCNLKKLELDWSYIYPIPAELGCRGTVTAVEFCYTIPTEITSNLIFYLSTLEHRNHTFIVRSSILINSTLLSNKCKGEKCCCDTIELQPTDQVQLHANDFAFGVTTPPSSVPRPIQIFSSIYNGTVLQKNGSLVVNMTYDLRAATDHLQALKFRLKPLPTSSLRPSLPEALTTTQSVAPSTTHAPPTNMSTEPPAVDMSIIPTSQSVSPSNTVTQPINISMVSSDKNTPIPSKMTIVHLTTATPIPSPSMGMPSSLFSTDINESPVTSSTATLDSVASIVLPSNTLSVGTVHLGVVMGGAVGGGIAVLLMLICISLLTILMFSRARRSPKEITGEGDLVISNEVTNHRGSETMIMDDVRPAMSNPVYAVVGPRASHGFTDNGRQAGAEEQDIIYSAIGNTKSEFLPQEYEAFVATKDAHPAPLDYETFVPINGIRQDPPEYATLLHKGRKTVNKQATQNLHEHDDIYMAPANNVDGLYAQLEEMLTDDISTDNISLGDMLGSGQFGEVYKGVWERNKNSVEVAIKILKEDSSEDDKVKFLQEAAIMCQFKHPNVVTIYGVITVGEPIMLVMEMLKKGDLRNYLLSMRTDNESISPEIDDHELLSYCRQVALGMAYLSNKAFVHRDLAARNILVSDDKICKIADFGMSRDLVDESYYVSHGGMIPVKWTAPEALCYQKYSTASDVWSFGVVMYEIWSLGHKPFERVDNGKMVELMNSGYRLPPPPGCPRAIYSIMMSCWHIRTDGRPNFSEVSTQLSVSNSKLLHWSQDDKSEFPEASRLGANPTCAKKLYKDMQIMYKKQHTRSLNL